MPVLERAANVYSTTVIELPDSFEPTTALYLTPDGYRAVLVRQLDDDGLLYESAVADFDADGRLIKTQLLESMVEGSDGYVSRIAPSGDFIYYLEYYTDSEGHRLYAISRAAENGCELVCADASTLFTGLDDAGKAGFLLRGVLSDDEGDIYMITDNSVLIYDGDFKRIGQIDHDHMVSNFSASGGKVQVTAYDLTDRGMVQSTFLVDKKNLKLGEKLTAPEGFSDNSTQIIFGEGYDYYLKNSAGLYGCNSSAEPKLLCDWLNSDLNSYYLWTVIVRDPDTLLALHTDTAELFLMKKVPDEEVPLREIIRVAECTGDRSITNHALEFNRSQEKYRVVVDYYSQYDQPTQLLLERMQSDDIPDVISNANLQAAWETYLSSGLFADLTPLIERDEDFELSELVACVAANPDDDGGLYELITSFNAKTLAVKKALYPSDGWTVDEYLDFAEALPDKSLAVWSFEPSRMFGDFVKYSLGEWVDYGAKSCDFEKTSFKRLLEFCKNIPEIEQFAATLDEIEPADLTNSAAKMAREDILTVRPITLSGFEDMMEAEFEFSEEVNFVGYPSGGAYIGRSRSWAISHDCASKDGAWLFLKQLLLEQTDSTGFSASKSKTDENLERALESRYFYNTSGRGYLTRTTTDAQAESYIQRKLPELILDRESAERTYSLLDGATLERSTDDKIAAIIKEEADYFFAGEKSADEVITVIGDRVSLILAEQ